ELTPTDAAKRERDAVDAVLSQLQDLEPQSASSTARGDGARDSIDVELWLPAANGLPVDGSLAEAEGGMVLLDSRGEANDAAVNLANGRDDHLDGRNVRG